MIEWSLIDWVGLVGGAAMLLAFWRGSISAWKHDGVAYQLTNLIACALLLFYSVGKSAHVSSGLNIVWGAVALYALAKILSAKKSRTKKKISKKR